MRWRQENALKYLKEHYAIEQMIQYGAEEEQNEHRVANPKRKKLNRRIKETQKDIEELEAQLGRAVENSVGKTTTGLKIAQAPLRRELESKRQVLNRLQTRLGHTPSVIAITELEGGEPRELLKQDRRLIVNTLKMVAYNAERLLAMKFNGHYKQDKDVFSIFRSLFHLPGKVVYVSKERVEVRLERPRPEKSAKALELLCEDLNSQEPRLFTSGPILNFGVSN
jgi:hypothetical protein